MSEVGIVIKTRGEGCKLGKKQLFVCMLDTDTKWSLRGIAAKNSSARIVPSIFIRHCIKDGRQPRNVKPPPKKTDGYVTKLELVPDYGARCIEVYGRCGDKHTKHT